MDKAESWLYKTLHYRFEDAGLLNQALTHRSATGRNNERLEFLGDAVLDLVISDTVYRARPDASEGDLSRLRSSLVKEKTLAVLAADLGVGDHLILGSGEKKTGGHRRDSILADALESIIGAVFLDSGIEAATEIIEHMFAQRLDKTTPAHPPWNEEVGFMSDMSPTNPEQWSAWAVALTKPPDYKRCYEPLQ